MTERYAIYYAPAADSALWRKAEAWLTQPELLPLTETARRYGFHATIKAPMVLAEGTDRAGLEQALVAFSAVHGPVGMGRCGAHVIGGGFLALTPIEQPPELTDFAAELVEAFEDFRAPLEPEERERRLRALLTPRQVELVDAYGYPYVFEEFQLHMTLTDRLPVELREPLQQRAEAWFVDELAQPMMLDRLVVFHEAAAGEPFRRLDGDFMLRGT